MILAIMHYPYELLSGGFLMSFVSDLEPKTVWRHFDEILKIPRGSKNEHAMREYVIALAQRNGLRHKTDKVGNVVVPVPASPGRERAPITILQSHLDMVNDKNSDVQHDFNSDPILPRRDGEYLKASGTTLGSDNGIGVAAALSLMDAKEVTHGPLELLFTIDEESGLTGASNLGHGLLEGKCLINLDTEEEGALYVGCAGGAGSDLTLPLKSVTAPKTMMALLLKVIGLRGGHSGVDIHLQRGNASKLLARALYRARRNKVDFNLAAFSGGNKHNAIPREAFARVVLPAKLRNKFEQAVQAEMANIIDEYRAVDPDIKLIIEDGKAKEMWEARSTHKVIALIQALPHGVLAMSNDIPGLVETSTNVAVITSTKNKLAVHCSTRSSVAAALTAARDRIQAIAEFAGAKVKESEGYPGWKPNLNSHVLQVARETHNRLFGKDPAIKAIHAGLECGIIGEKYPGMDMVSMGPQIEFPHSPDERVKIKSVGDFYKLLTGTLERLAA
jgi:dipeptidase D